MTNLPTDITTRETYVIIKVLGLFKADFFTSKICKSFDEMESASITCCSLSCLILSNKFSEKQAIQAMKF